MKPRPHYETTSEYLPQHPAVAYLFLVGRAHYLTFVTLPSAITIHGPPPIEASAWYV
jgi:hypothetical protein